MKHKQLVIDIGNTRQKLGVFDGDKLTTSLEESADHLSPQLWQSWKESFKPVSIALSTTAILSDQQKVWIERNKVLQVSAALNYPFKNLYQTPETLGQDRLAAVTAAYALYRGKNVLVIDSGTCITYDLLTAEGYYMGGDIAPGIGIRLKSMHHYTDSLPLVDLPRIVRWIGRTTEEALQNGAVAMAIMEARGLIFYLKEKYGHLTSVLTGGNTNYYKDQLPGITVIMPDLVLRGLNEIIKYNET